MVTMTEEKKRVLNYREVKAEYDGHWVLFDHRDFPPEDDMGYWENYFPEIVTPSKQHHGSRVTPFWQRSDDMAVMSVRIFVISNDTIVSLMASVTFPFSIRKLFLATPDISPLAPDEPPEKRFIRIPRSIPLIIS